MHHKWFDLLTDYLYYKDNVYWYRFGVDTVKLLNVAV